MSSSVRQQYICYGCMRTYQAGEEICPKCGYRHHRETRPEYALRPGTTLHDGKYLVGKVLGEGGFGITYIGLDTVLKLKVAIKEYFPRFQVNRSQSTSVLLWDSNSDGGASGKESFLKEARKMARVDSIPGIVQVRDIFCQNNTAYIIMNFVEGRNLKDRLRYEGKMPLISCMEVLFPIMDALMQAHEYDLIHRDISPDNIMIDHRGKAWLLDMGAAKDLETGASDAMRHSEPVIKRGFSPPEQNVGRDIGPWTDVYAMCATIYYSITGCLVPDAMERLLRDTVTYPSDILPELKGILSHGLALHVHDRIQTIGELKQQLLSFLERLKTRIRETLKEFPYIGLSFSGQHVYVSAFIDGQPIIIHSSKVEYTDKWSLFLNPVQFNIAMDKVLDALRKVFQVPRVEMLLCIPDVFGFTEISMIFRNAKDAGVNIKRIVTEGCAGVFYAVFLREEREFEQGILFSSIDHIQSVDCLESGDGIVEILGTYVTSGGQKASALVIDKSDLEIYPDAKLHIYQMGDYVETAELFNGNRNSIGKSYARSHLPIYAPAAGAAVMIGVLTWEIGGLVLVAATGPYDLCVSVNGEMRRMIGKFTPIPTRKSDMFEVGESALVKLCEDRGNNTYYDVGSLNVTRKKSTDPIEVSIDIDADYHVRTTVTDAGKKIGEMQNF